MSLIRLVFFGFIICSLIYVAVSWYSRSVRREKLENQWAEENPDGDIHDRAAFVQSGIDAYNSGLRPKLVLLVYIVPAVLVIAAFFMTN